MAFSRFWQNLAWISPLLVLLSGCVGTVPDAPPQTTTPPTLSPPSRILPPDYDFSRALVAVHDHAEPTLHKEHYNLELVGYNDLSEASDPLILPGGHMEVALADHWAFVSNYGPHRGLAIVDVSDPRKPHHVSDFNPNSLLDPTTMGGTGSYWDVSVFPDGNLVVLSAQVLANGPISPQKSQEMGGGVYLVNAEDKEHPVMESFTPVLDSKALIPVGVHNANPFFVNHVPYVAATTANGATTLFEVLGEAPHRTLRAVSEVFGMHDTTVQVHPLEGVPYIYGAKGGVYITDISDPAHPEVVSNLPNGPDMQAYHQVIPSDVLIEGRHYTVATTESMNGVPVKLTILDTTDPADPSIVGHWVLPLDVPANKSAPYRFSPHNMDFDHGRLYIGHYHAGVWVVDVSSAENIRNPVTMGFYQPHNLPLFVPRTPHQIDVPSVWNAIRHTDGFIYASDVNMGLYVLEFTGPPSPLEGEPVWVHNVN